MAKSPSAYFSLGSGLVSVASALFGGNPQKRTADIYANAQDPFAAAQQFQSASTDEYAKDASEQAALAISESARTAQQTAREAHNFREEQSLGYSASGVLLEGSPMLVLEETRKLARQEVAAIMDRGLAQAKYMNRQGYIAQSEGRAKMIGRTMEFENQKGMAQIGAMQAGSGGLVSALSNFDQLFAGFSPTGSKKTKKPNPLNANNVTPLTPIHGQMPLIANQNMLGLSAAPYQGSL